MKRHFRIPRILAAGIIALIFPHAATLAATHDVVQHGAVPDDARDDSAAIQRAIDAAKPGDTVLFPAGTFRVVSVNVRTGLRYEGRPGSVLLRHGTQPNWTRTFTSERAGFIHESDRDSAPTVFTGLTFDGNRAAQGSDRGYEKEQAHLLFLGASPARGGRLKVEIRGCHFRECVADGISLHTNVDAVVADCSAENCFRGGLVLTGGHSRLKVRGFTTGGDAEDTGIDIEVDGEGHRGSLAADIVLENLRLHKGDFDIAVSDGSRVSVTDVTANAPFYLYARGAKVDIRRSSFGIGAATGFINRIVKPGQVTFTECSITTVRKGDGDPADAHGLEVYWEVGDDRPRGQALAFRGCRFECGPGFRPSEARHALVSKHATTPNNHRLVIDRRCSFGAGFTQAVVVEDGGVAPEKK